MVLDLRLNEKIGLSGDNLLFYLSLFARITKDKEGDNLLSFVGYLLDEKRQKRRQPSFF